MLAQSLVAPLLLVAGCTILVCAALYRGLGWCLPVSAAFAVVGAHGLARSRLAGALTRSRLGWCGALPLHAGATPRALLVVTSTAVAAAIIAMSALLTLAALPAPHRDVLGFGLMAVDGGLVAGTAAAALHVLRPGAMVRRHHADGIREPLLALPWLNAAHLPHLLDWQRRAALVKWRRGGFALVAGVLIAVPDGAAIPGVVALVLLAASLAWFDVVMRTSARVTFAAAGLLRATPLSAHRMRWTALRYPLVAGICASTSAVIAVALPDAGPIPLLIWLACALAAAVWPVHCIARAVGKFGPAP